ncbi:GNAT family N-acetyltransferase [Flagellimonas sp. HMM57]|uniref:GNAT family N-acetyltransferase n=1 Tax=unclassified Flagellimonas TaxID=2644544 RepID=UPI0013D2892B|nr:MULTISPECIES: GNAT family N-acetyltransferase [unclassified Flagellimonas]UII77791.1 GNAT family N-acetyltransferase [Flagellimonas sp. HMM57]
MKIVTQIRFARPDDVEAIIDLCEAHAIYEQSSYIRNGKNSKLKKDLFGKKKKLYCLVVESNDELIGYATYMKQYATWSANDYIYIDCLFLKELARGMGVGKKLMQRIKVEGEQMGCRRMEWQTPYFNQSAIKFYNQIGASSKTKERFFLHLE